MMGAGVLAVLFLFSYTAGDVLVTRRHPVDTFSMKGSCAGGCIGTSMGTALALSSDGCTCACAPHLPAFREDMHICVDDLHDCPLIAFISGTTYQKIPFVFLPLKGQIVYPSAELVFAGVESPICVVSSAKYLSASGWDEIRNRSDAEPPFRLFRDEGRTFLQWLGDTELRISMEGRLILVHLMCKDMLDEQNPDNNIFTSCVSFRVAGTPSEINPKNGVKEVTFSVDSQQQSQNMGSSYIIIAVSSVLLGLIYIVSVLLYLQGKKKKAKYHENSNDPLAVAEEGIVKNNPLLKHCHDNIAYLSDTPPSVSDSEEGSELPVTSEEIRTVQTTSVLIHPCSNDKEKGNTDSCQIQDSSNIERLPEENVSIVETLDYREERPETVRAISCANGRRKLYFNPAYFEPELLLAPPPAAIEFLTKIREVISIAKAKMEAKRFLPSLMGIPEESDYKASSLAGTESTVILRRGHGSKNKYCRTEHSRHARGLELGCHSCYKNSEQKQSSIQKWLENVPVVRADDETSSVTSSKKNKSLSNRKVSTFSANHGNKDEKLCEEHKNNTLYENNDVICDLDKLKSHSYPSSIVSDSNSKDKEREKFNCNGSIKEENNDINKLNVTDQVLSSHEECDNRSNHSHSFRDSSMTYLNVSQKDMPGTLSESERNKLLQDLQSAYEPVDENNVWSDDYNDNDSLKMNNNSGVSSHSDYSNNAAEIMNKINTALTSETKIFDPKLANGKCLNKKEDHDYETIMLSKKNQEIQCVPDFINRSNGYSLVSEVYVNDGYDYISESSHSNMSSLNSNQSEDEIEYDRNSQGQLTIKVHDDPPLEYCNDSDSFEPDTLDRKPNKLKINQEVNINIEKNQDIYADSLERPPHISLKSSGTFKSDTAWNNVGTQNGSAKHPLNRAFGSLREIFEAKTKYNQCSHNKSIKSCSPVGSTKSLNYDPEGSPISWKRGKPKLLRPEGKHARRQRSPSPPNHSVLKPPSSEEPPVATASKREGGPPLPPRIVKPPLPPKNASVRSNSRELNTKNQTAQPNNSAAQNFKKNSYHRFTDIASESSEYELLNSQEYNCFKNKSTEFRPDRDSKLLREKRSSSQRKQITDIQNRTEDSGYLSTDSNGSDPMITREDSISETDDSFFDGASESGAESIATDSFFFGNGRKFANANSDNLSNSSHHQLEDLE